MLTMEKLEMLKTLVNERLSIAAEEIYGMGARIIWEVDHQYKAEVARLRMENERQRKLLETMLKPDVRLQRAALSEEKVCSEKKKRNHCLGQDVCQPPEKEMRQEDPADGSEVTSLIVESSVEENTPPLNEDIYSDEEDCEISEQTEDDDGHLSTPTTPSRKKRKIRVPHSGRLVCKVCAESFDTKKILISHVKEHSKDCGLCGQALEPTESLKVHLQAHRTCDVCGKRFNKFITLAKHMRIRHTEGKSLTCTICCKTFRKANLLQSHSRMHRPEKPYSCTICEKTFRHSTSLDNHKRVHTGAKPFSCKICDKRFRQKTHLTKHMTTHTGDKPFKCTICNESFRLKGTMKNHMFRHAGEKAFPCSICGKRLARLDSMLRHKKLHERESVEGIGSDGKGSLSLEPVQGSGSSCKGSLSLEPVEGSGSDCIGLP